VKYETKTKKYDEVSHYISMEHIKEWFVNLSTPKKSIVKKVLDNVSIQVDKLVKEEGQSILNEEELNKLGKDLSFLLFRLLFIF
jgi:hypothetical protein